MLYPHDSPLLRETSDDVATIDFVNDPTLKCVSDVIGSRGTTAWNRSSSSRLQPPIHFGQREDTRKGNRPSFSDAAPPEEAELRYDRFCQALARQGIHVARGVFGARMAVELVNDGPVTIVLG